MGEAIISRRGGGGTISGVVEQYTVAAGESVAAGDIVKIVDEAETISGITYVWQAVAVTDNKALVFYTRSGKSSLYARYITFVNGEVVVGEDMSLGIADPGSSFKSSNCCMIDANKALLLITALNSSSEWDVSGYILTLGDSSITCGPKKYICEIYANYDAETTLIKLSSTCVLMTYYHYTDARYIGVLSISGNAITLTSITWRNAGWCAGMRLSDTSALLAYHKSDALYAAVATVNGTALSLGTPVLCADSFFGNATDPKPVNPVTLRRLTDTSAAIFSNSAYKGIVISADSGIITAGSVCVLNRYFVSSGGKNPYNYKDNLGIIEHSSNRYLLYCVMASLSKTVAMDVNISGNDIKLLAYTESAPCTIYTSPKTEYVDVLPEAHLLLEFDRGFVYNSASSVKRLHRKIGKAGNDTRIAGIAKTGGVAGETIDVIVPAEE